VLIKTSRDTDSTVWKRWLRHAEARPDDDAVIHWRAGEVPHRWRWGALLAEAAGYAARLEAEGVRKGDVCAVIARHNPQFYPLYMGVEALGALPAVLAYPNARLHPDKFRAGLQGMAQRSGLDWVLTESELSATLLPLISAPGSSVRRVLCPFDWPHAAGDPWLFSPDVDPDSPCLLQHSSGTTGLQKAVMLSHRAVLGHTRRYAEAIALAPDDKIASWLPLYHDMGLIAAFHLPLSHGIPVVQLDPFEWVAAPALLLEAISNERATIAWLPNFAYNLLADRVHDDDLEGVRLDHVRLFVNCSEPVRAESHQRFAERFAVHGLRRSALSACYAMAETTFAVTQTTPGGEARVLAASREALAAGEFQPAYGEPVRLTVSSGRPIEDCCVRVVDEAGCDLPDGRVGEVVIQSASSFHGYRNNPARTAEVLRDGWYYSGDYGFRWEGELYVIGRKKDLIIVAGKNLYPEDIEDAVSSVSGVLPGRVVAFGLDDQNSGTEHVCVVAETALPEEEQRTLRRRVLEAGMAIDVSISRVHFVPPRWLIKSSAGKPSRSANRERILVEGPPTLTRVAV
jgi:fatty-acyl-CoA synthase